MIRLHTELLQELHQRWRAQGAPIADALAPGIDDEQIERLTAPLGLRVSEEARVWWRWHNGVASTADCARSSWDRIGPTCRWRTPSLTARPVARWVLTSTAIRPRPRGRARGCPSPWTSCESSLTARCPTKPTYPSRSFSFEEPEAAADGLPSLGELVRLWVEVIDSGAWRWRRNSAGGTWQIDHDALPEDIQDLRLT